MPHRHALGKPCANQRKGRPKSPAIDDFDQIASGSKLKTQPHRDFFTDPIKLPPKFTRLVSEQR
jgi:hypothetical protein